MKTYGAWKVTEAEYQKALDLSCSEDPICEEAYQVVRYCRGQIFDSYQAGQALQVIRFPGDNA